MVDGVFCDAEQHQYVICMCVMCWCVKQINASEWTKVEMLYHGGCH